MSQGLYIYGKNTVEELFKARVRGARVPIQKVYLTRAGEKDSFIMSTIQSNRLTYSIVTEEELEHHVGRGAVHQGVAVLIDGGSLYQTLPEVLAEEKEGKKIIVVLDHLEDPHNVGAIMRSCLAFGVDAVIMPEHNQAQITSVVAKASSGAIFSIPIISSLDSFFKTLDRVSG